MDEEPLSALKPAVPPPDIPKPAIPPPDLPKAQEPIPAVSAAPPVNVRIREVGDSDDDAPQSGSLVPFNTRVIAAVIDLVVAIGLQISVLWILPSFASRIAWLVGIGYMVTRDSLPFLGGQSVGKKAMKLQVVTLEDKPITGNWEAALIRNGVLLIPFFGLIEIFVLLTREDKPERGRRLGDEWAKTNVIIAVEPPKPTDGPVDIV
jgi:uncharacterized RDD family membrane protein YckC